MDSNILKNTYKIDFEVVLFNMAELSLQNMILHTKVGLRHVAKPF